MSRIPIEMGQVSIFDIPINEPKPKIKETTVDIDFDKSIINTYRYRANKIVKTFAGRYLVFEEDEVIHLTKEGKEDFRSLGSPSILPMDSILFSVKDEPVNELQNRRLEQFSVENDVDKVIKRFGDKNYILITKEGRTLGINPKGWIIPYESKAVYKDIDENNEITVGKHVRVTYKDIIYEGVATRIYGLNNTTINVSFAGSNTAFYRGNVKLIS